MKRNSVSQPKELLIRRWRELRESLEMDLLNLGDDREDLYDDNADFGINEAESLELQLIDRALKRLRDGLYGFCEKCGSPISKTRLRLLPHATRCIKCQAENEPSRSHLAKST